MTCNHCGSKLEEEANYCTFCDRPHEVQPVKEVNEVNANEEAEEPQHQNTQYDQPSAPTIDKNSKRLTAIGGTILSILLILSGTYKMWSGCKGLFGPFGKKEPASIIKIDNTTEMSGEFLTGDGWSMGIVKGWTIDDDGDLIAPNTIDNIKVLTDTVSSKMTEKEYSERVNKMLDATFENYKLISEGHYKIGDYDGYYTKCSVEAHGESLYGIQYYIIKDRVVYAIANWTWKEQYKAGVNAMLDTFTITAN